MKKCKRTIEDKIIILALKNVKKLKGGPFAAAVTLNGKIISQAANAVTAKNDPTAHAEIEAIRKAAKKLKTYDLSKCEIYASCKPCPMCLSAIYWANIKKVHYCAQTQTACKYGFKDGFIFEELSKPENKRKIREIKSAAVSEDPSAPFKAWKMLADKKKY
ncbi:MAG: nucleoside deaminase [Endomicrobium sp.]|jgi:guanine deaminase|nr:nucleoside deaminase [Endomicrobium sp.]